MDEADSPPHETWKDWEWKDPDPQYLGLDEPELLTRVALLAILERLGLDDVSERKLRFWEKAGVLPAPVRRWHEGATRAVYPRWYVNLVFDLRHFQERGYELNQLPNRMRLLARYHSYAEEAYGHPDDDVEERWRTEEPPVLPFPSYHERPEIESWFESKIKPFLLDKITPLSQPSYYRAGRLIAVELTLVDEEGERLTLSAAIPEPAPKPPRETV